MLTPKAIEAIAFVYGALFVAKVKVSTLGPYREADADPENCIVCVPSVKMEEARMELVKNKKVDRVLDTPPDAANPLVVEINIEDVTKLFVPVSWPFRNTGPWRIVLPRFVKVDGP